MSPSDSSLKLAAPVCGLDQAPLYKMPHKELLWQVWEKVTTGYEETVDGLAPVIFVITV